jgi:hypothetical protein
MLTLVLLGVVPAVAGFAMTLNPGDAMGRDLFVSSRPVAHVALVGAAIVWTMVVVGSRRASAPSGVSRLLGAYLLLAVPIVLLVSFEGDHEICPSGLQSLGYIGTDADPGNCAAGAFGLLAVAAVLELVGIVALTRHIRRTSEDGVE